MLTRQEKLKRMFESEWNDVYHVKKYSCIVCGKTFYTKQPTQKYCSYECKAIGYNQRRRVNRLSVANNNICAVCGNTFHSKRSNARYCSNACKQKAYRERVTDIKHTPEEVTV